LVVGGAAAARELRLLLLFSCVRGCVCVCERCERRAASCLFKRVGLTERAILGGGFNEIKHCT
jgi:hypothetical protein